MTDNAIRLLAEGDPAAGMTPSDFTAPDAFTGADRTERNHFFFATPDELQEVFSGSPELTDFFSQPANNGPETSQRRRLPSEVRMKAPLRVPTRPRTAVTTLLPW